MIRCTHAPSALMAARLEAALAFETMTDSAVEIAARATVIEHGGTLTEPQGQWGPLETEISLMGITGTGEGIPAAARNWTKHVLRSWAAMEAGDAA